MSKEILSCLSELSGDLSQEFYMWQNMFFDKSTGTVDHIDTFYLDTDPMGYLIAAWVALEDIDGKGGEFHVYPGSHLNNSIEWIGLNHDKFVAWSDELRLQYTQKPIHLKKGDVLFWHPSLLHGSSNQREEGYSRKSLTAHYSPTDVKRGGKGISTNPKTKTYEVEVEGYRRRLRRINSLPIYTNRRRRSLRLTLRGIKKYWLNLDNSPNMLMDRSAYKLKNSTVNENL